MIYFRLGNEKYKSKTVWRSLNPRWLEQLDLHLYDDGDQQLEITVWDKDRTKDDFMGRYVTFCLIVHYIQNNNIQNVIIAHEQIFC